MLSVYMDYISTIFLTVSSSHDIKAHVRAQVTVTSETQQLSNVRK